MTTEKHLELPFAGEEAKKLRAGDAVLLSGVIYTARDAAHKRMAGLLADGKPLPFPIAGQTIYYLGPSPARPGQVIGSAGPTTATRMDRYTPALLDLGLKGMIGKGRRSAEVVEAMKRNGAVYFAAIGGAGALLSKAITSVEIVAWEDLGTEAVRRLTVRDFPAIVAIDATGTSLYQEG
ncbi:MAG: Fe-S-containing hydro-lyase [Lachnospiraceae bacterium]|nr:Fe-S-containing hydro-lyase [Lachnospiraceae bacterium]